MPTRLENNMVTLRKAVEWIAIEDAPGDNDDIETLAGYVTVCLVADLFDVPAIEIARKVHAHRSRPIA